MLIIQIRGTSGSGKTTAMRRYMKIHRWIAKYVPRRKKPMYYYTDNGIVVLGHYESTCGGCDNVGSAAKVFELISSLDASKVKVVVCEGLLLSEDTKWTLKLTEQGHVVIPLFLTTPPEECVSRVIERRKQAGNEKDFNTNNTLKRVAVIERAYQKLKQKEIGVLRCRTELAPILISRAISDVLNPEKK